ncbi:hypothetical protein Pyn_31621 [Prunus yedoensis var. nudiflora]|uniref:Uncharacterized protein n=1 Tax=Prunus yedoensis var. nudiflora TaxID=2094558 RepID=A0A314YTD0_PRUYE|nr:hypothetical protein Pyn_31621 [Prunus yedoensis var. nudiflora]
MSSRCRPLLDSRFTFSSVRQRLWRLPWYGGLSWSAPAIVPTVSNSTTIMVQGASLGSAATVEVAFLLPPPLSDMRSQVLPLGEDGPCRDIWRGWLFT